MTNKDHDYFNYKIPQSEYRNAKEKTNEDRIKIDTSITKLNIKNEADKEALKEKIKESLLPIFTNFFPDNHHIEIMDGSYLGQLYKKLNL